MKELTSSIILETSALTCFKAEFAFCFFLSGFSFTIIDDSQDSRERRIKSLYTLSTTSARFTDTQKLAELLLQGAQLCVQLVAGFEPRAFGLLTQVPNHYATCSLDYALSKLALAAVVKRLLKTWVALGNISRILLNLIKRLTFAMFILLPLPMFKQLTFIFSLWLSNYRCFSQ